MSERISPKGSLDGLLPFFFFKTSILRACSLGPPNDSCCLVPMRGLTRLRDDVDVGCGSERNCFVLVASTSSLLQAKPEGEKRANRRSARAGTFGGSRRANVAHTTRCTSVRTLWTERETKPVLAWEDVRAFCDWDERNKNLFRMLQQTSPELSDTAARIDGAANHRANSRALRRAPETMLRGDINR